MLNSLIIWAIVTGIIFSIEFIGNTPVNNFKKTLLDTVIGFISGFIFTYFIVLVIGIIIFIPLGILSIFIPDIIVFATMQFALLLATYIIFILIAVDTPLMLFYVIKQGNWYFKSLGILIVGLLMVQTLKAILGGLIILMNHSIWRTNTFLVAIGLSLLVTIVVNIILLKKGTISKVVFTILIVYVASIITGNVSFGVFNWGAFLSFGLTVFIGPIIYSLVAKIIINQGINAVSGIFGFIGGLIIGIVIDQHTGLRIIGQGWFGILCGTLITAAFSIAFGLLWGPAISNFLITTTKIKPIIGFCIGYGLFFGIVVGMIAGGFLGR